MHRLRRARCRRKVRARNRGTGMAKIIAIETWLTRMPFDMGAKPVTFGGIGWQAMNTLWLRVATDDGREGWGEGFGHAGVAATRAVIDTQLAPAVLGQDARDIAGLRRRTSQGFHLFGGNGAARLRPVGARHRVVGPRRQGGRAAAVAAVGRGADRGPDIVCQPASLRRARSGRGRRRARDGARAPRHQAARDRIADDPCGTPGGRRRDPPDGGYQLSLERGRGDANGAAQCASWS